MTQNLALVIQKPGVIKLEERPLPAPAPDEALVEVQYTALCGSDVKLYNGTYTAPHRYPVVVGHEWVGRVVSTGNEVTDLQPGDVVTGDCSVFCGACPMCAVNKNHCENIEKSGITVDGKCANYITAKRMHIYKCPPLDDIKPLVLTEPMAVSVNGVFCRVPEPELKRAKNALVLGAGGIGILATLALCEYPLPRIVVVDVAEDKLELVKSFGLPGVEICNNVSAINEQFDIVVEAAGQSATLAEAARLTAPAGHIVCLGHQKTVELDFGTIIAKSLTLHASNGSTGDFTKAIQIIVKRQQIVSQLITTTVKLSNASDYIAGDLHNTKNIKVVIDLRPEALPL